MKWGDIGKKIAQSAPLIGGALGGPGGAAMGAIVASVLGVDAQPAVVAQAIQNDPKAALKLAEWEMKNAVHLRNHHRAILDLELRDTQHAREQHKLSIVPAILVFMLTGLVAAGGYLLFYTSIPADNREVMFMLFGNVVTAWLSSVAYWVGTSRSSNVKDVRKQD